ncbi:MAG TPA: hypothetical protein VJ781_01125, partial [Pyrinomonadaceae bacterium]|nr:hypothetical protein [Pyrinomonadaceae bacterium]
APETRGAIFFSFKSLRNDLGGIQNALMKTVYQRDALIPTSPWIKSAVPKPPKVTITRTDRFTTANWVETGRTKAFWFVVYAKDKDGWSYSILPSREKSIALSSGRKIESVVVRSVDRLGNESR